MQTGDDIRQYDARSKMQSFVLFLHNVIIMRTGWSVIGYLEKWHQYQ